MGFWKNLFATSDVPLIEAPRVILSSVEASKMLELNAKADKLRVQKEKLDFFNEKRRDILNKVANAIEKANSNEIQVDFKRLARSSYFEDFVTEVLKPELTSKGYVNIRYISIPKYDQYYLKFEIPNVQQAT